MWFCFALAFYVELPAAQFEAITRWQSPVSLCYHPVIFWIFIHRSDSLSNTFFGNAMEIFTQWSLRNLDGMKQAVLQSSRVAVCLETV